MLTLILLQYFQLLPLSHIDHAIYISVIEIEPKEIKVKVFQDDLKDAIRNEANEQEYAARADFYMTESQSFERYFQGSIKIKEGNRVLRFSLKDIQIEGDSYWITFTIQNPRIQELQYEMEADYLMELFPDQMNIIKVKGRKLQLFRLTKGNSNCSFLM